MDTFSYRMVVHSGMVGTEALTIRERPMLHRLQQCGTRYGFKHNSLSGTIANKGIVEPLSFVMARKTLLNVGQRAEAVAAGKANLAFNN